MMNILARWRWLLLGFLIVGVIIVWAVFNDPTPRIQTPAQQIAYSPNGQFLAAAAGYKIEIWTMPQRQLIQTLSVCPGGFGALVVAWSPDSKLIATISPDASLEIWRVNDAMLLHTLKGHTYAITAVAFSSDGSLVAAAGHDSTAIVWDVLTGQLVQSFEHSEEYVSSIAFTPDAQWLASGSSAVYMWKIHPTKNDTHRLHIVNGEILSLAISQDGHILIAGDADGIVKVVSLDNHSLLYKIQAHDGAVDTLAISPDGRYFATAGGLQRNQEAGETVVRLWDIHTGNLKLIFTGQARQSASLAFSPDGHTLASASEEGFIRFWPIE